MLPHWLNNMFYFLVFGLYIADYIVDKRWLQFKFSKTSIPFVLMIAFFLISLLQAPFDSDTYYKTLLEKRYPLIAFGIIGLLGLNDKFKLSYFLNTIIITAVSITLWNAFFNVDISNIFQVQFPLLFTQERIAHINSHMGFNLYLNLAVVSLWYICYHSWKDIPKWKKSGYIVSFIIIYMILLISEGSSGFLACNVLVFCMLFIYIYDRNKKIALASLFFLLVAFFIVASQLFPHLSKDNIETEPRLYMWRAAVESIQERPLSGYGMSRAQETLDSTLFKYGNAAQQKTWVTVQQSVKYVDSHNQYIQVTLEFGIVGLLVLLGIYLSPLFAVDKNKLILTAFICFLFCFQSMFDMFITGQFSILFGLVWLIVIKTRNDLADNQ